MAISEAPFPRVPITHEAYEWYSPTPPNVFVIDSASKCDLACKGCMVYELAGNKEEGQPRVTPASVLQTTADKIGEHIERHKLPAVDVRFFGGEPTLPGAERLAGDIDIFKKTVGKLTELTVGISTNGVRLGKDPELRSMLSKRDVQVAISLDGHPALNDKYRMFPRGKRYPVEAKGTYRDIARGITHWNEENPDNRAAILATIHNPEDEDNVPELIYDTITSFKPRAIDFLLNHEIIPGKPGLDSATDFLGHNPGASYGDWMDAHSAVAQHGRWLSNMYDLYKARPVAPIRTFDAIEALLCGRQTNSPVFGITRVGLVAITASGELELDPAYFGTFDNARRTGITIFDENPFERFVADPLVAINQIGAMGLSATCRGCSAVEVCGGGLHAHRYRDRPSSDEGLPDILRHFDWPTQYCLDSLVLISHIARSMNAAQSAD